ncbi:PGAP1-like protein [Pseudoduganella lurida]|uniref:PGAP1-like protein n=1 Tax=Pseudoduganella lurida TaxID=1036180 RepID=A0A562RP20_9BURK|nr:alpha/beta fold hydrolase [Pseudoduganella lurida]TWI70120.1 PGAP1-like protein [Pseudoduganella lurida]
MVVAILLSVMLVQIAAALAIWYAATGWMPADLALLGAVLAVALVRMAINANNFRMARRAGSVVPPEHRLDPLGRLRLFAGEYRASMLSTSWHMLRHRPAPCFAGTSAALPVLLVHGYGCNGGYWAPLRALLRREGIRHDAVDLVPVTASIEDYVPQLEAAVQRLLAATGAPRIVLVCHSMGGLVARAWLRRHPDGAVARIVTIATPHHGTALAHLGPGENARQMRIGADWLKRLAHDDFGRRALFTSIWSWHDNIVAPQDSCRLPGAKDIAFGGIGHVALGSDPRVLRAVLSEVHAAAALTPLPTPGTIN